MRSGTWRYWQLCGKLLGKQLDRLADDGIRPHDRFGEEGSHWTPAVDLALGDPDDWAYPENRRFVPARSVWSVAHGRAKARLRCGSILRLEAVCPDPHVEALGTNFWSIDRADLGVSFIHSALEGRWGGAASLADNLIVPTDHPLVGDLARADRLVLDLQEITRAFRVANGLPADGEIPVATARR